GGFNSASVLLLLLAVGKFETELDKSTFETLYPSETGVYKAVFEFGKNPNMPAYKNFAKHCIELNPEDVVSILEHCNPLDLSPYLILGLGIIVFGVCSVVQPIPFVPRAVFTTCLGILSLGTTAFSAK